MFSFAITIDLIICHGFVLLHTNIPRPALSIQRRFFFSKEPQDYTREEAVFWAIALHTPFDGNENGKKLALLMSFVFTVEDLLSLPFSIDKRGS